jgi:hypothetical protein
LGLVRRKRSDFLNGLIERELAVTFWAPYLLKIANSPPIRFYPYSRSMRRMYSLSGLPVTPEQYGENDCFATRPSTYRFAGNTPVAVPKVLFIQSVQRAGTRVRRPRISSALQRRANECQRLRKSERSRQHIKRTIQVRGSVRDPEPLGYLHPMSCSRSERCCRPRS